MKRAPGGKEEFDGLEHERLKAIAASAATRTVNSRPGDEFLDQGLAERGAHDAAHFARSADSESTSEAASIPRLSPACAGLTNMGKAETAQGVVAVVEHERRERRRRGYGRRTS